MAEDGGALQTRIQSLMTSGDLPCEDCVVTWYGQGRDRHCAACDRRILATDTEIECDVPGTAPSFFISRATTRGSRFSRPRSDWAPPRLWRGRPTRSVGRVKRGRPAGSLAENR